MENKEYRDPMTAKIAELQDQGYKTEFIVKDGDLKDRDGNSYQASSMTITNEFRFEGESNPDDMAILYAIAGDEGKGYISNAYGTYADDGVNSVIDKMNDQTNTTKVNSPDTRDH
jgi:hypothetical protein